MKYKKIGVSLLLVILVLLTSCSQQTIEQTNEAIRRQEVHSSTHDQARLEKENAYIALYNALGGEVYIALTHYQEVCGWEPKLQAENPNTLYPLDGETAEALKMVLSFAEQEPHLEELDQLILEIAPLLDDFLHTWQNMADYYGQQLYLQDDYYQGQLYHTDILNLYNDMYPLLTALEEHIALLDVQRRAETIDYCQQQGLLVEYHLLQIIQTAGELSAFVEEHYDDETDFIDAPLQELAAYYNTLTTHIEGFREAIGDGEQAEKEKYLTGHESFSLLVAAVDGLEECAEDLLRQVEEDAENIDSTQQFDTHLYKITEAYNSVLS